MTGSLTGHFKVDIRKIDFFNGLCANSCVPRVPAHALNAKVSNQVSVAAHFWKRVWARASVPLLHNRRSNLHNSPCAVPLPMTWKRGCLKMQSHFQTTLCETLSYINTQISNSYDEPSIMWKPKGKQSCMRFLIFLGRHRLVLAKRNHRLIKAMNCCLSEIKCTTCLSIGPAVSRAVYTVGHLRERAAPQNTNSFQQDKQQGV